MIADQLNVKLGRPPYRPYAADGTLTNAPMDAALEQAVKERKAQIEIDNAISREIEKKIAAQVPATDHPYTRNEKIEKIVIDTAAKYGETNLAHLIGRHAAKRVNPSTGKVSRTNDDMVSRLVTGVGSDQKDAVLATPNTVKTTATAGGPVRNSVTANLASGGSVTVPDYANVGQETGPSSSQHASAKAALFMMEAAAAEAARLGRQVAAQEAVRLGRQAGPDNFTAGGAQSVKIDIGTENIDGEVRGGYKEKGKLGKSYEIPNNWKLQNADRGYNLPTADIRDRILRTTVTGDNPSAVATLIPDLIHGGVNLMTMFTKKEAFSGGSKLTKRVGQKRDVTGAQRAAIPAANEAKAQLAAARDAQARLTKLTQAGGPQKTAEAAAALAETNKKNDQQAFEQAIANLPEEKRVQAVEASVFTTAAEQAMRDSDRSEGRPRQGRRPGEGVRGGPLRPGDPRGDGGLREGAGRRAHGQDRADDGGIGTTGRRAGAFDRPEQRGQAEPEGAEGGQGRRGAGEGATGGGGLRTGLPGGGGADQGRGRARSGARNGRPAPAGVR